MRIFICCSKHHYKEILPLKEELEKKGHEVTLPNSYDKPFMEEEVKKQGKESHREWKSKMINLQKEKIMNNDAVLVFNLEKNGQKDYIGGATFLEMFKAWELKKKIFLYNEISSFLIPML